MSDNTAEGNRHFSLFRADLRQPQFSKAELPKGNRQQATGNRQQATGNRQQATGNRQQATGNYTLILNIQVN